MPKKIGRIRQPTFLVKKVLAKEYSDSNAKIKIKLGMNIQMVDYIDILMFFHGY